MAEAPTYASPSYMLADHLVDGGIREFIDSRRRPPVRSWRRIALDLRDATNGKVDITYETVRAWHLADQGSAA